VTFDLATAREWAASIAPYASIAATLYVALRVRGVHLLVNSQMDEFRATLNQLLEARVANSFLRGEEKGRADQAALDKTADDP